jgi:acyl-CoA synthetase (AMP-forming)/AMP-acid ligase II
MNSAPQRGARTCFHDESAGFLGRRSSMNISMLLEMAAEGCGDRIALGPRDGGLTYVSLFDMASRAATHLRRTAAERVALIGLNGPAVPVALYGGALAGLPFVPLNYRLTNEQLQAVLERVVPAVVVVDASVSKRFGGIQGIELVEQSSFLDLPGGGDRGTVFAETGGSDHAALLFTSGTSGEPKAAILRHQNLTSYILAAYEFMSSTADDCALVSVPPYHIASISAYLSNIYTGRRIVQLPSFDEHDWVRLARDESVTFALVVPTMLKRILDVIEAEDVQLPALRQLSYGGGVMPAPVIERALQLMPHVDFVNAYGLTETSSTVAMLDADDHREALVSTDPEVRARLGSVGRPLPTVELEVRDESGHPVPAGITGEIWVRGEQVSGEYVGKQTLRPDGWFLTNDAGRFDAHGYLYVEGRLDDVIVRGGENISPGEIEEVLLEHRAVADAAVCGIPDHEWGEVVAATVVLRDGRQASADELRHWVRDHLRSTRVPAVIEFRSELPYNDVGKLPRRVLREQISRASDQAS